MGLKTEFTQLDLILDELEELKETVYEKTPVRELTKLINQYKKTNLDIIWVEDKAEFMEKVEDLLCTTFDNLYEQQTEYKKTIVKALTDLLTMTKSNMSKTIYTMCEKALKYVSDTLKSSLLKHYYELFEKIRKDIKKAVKEGKR